jgi:hypothetical protein
MQETLLNRLHGPQHRLIELIFLHSGQSVSH